MAFSVTQRFDPATEEHVVRVRVGLTLAETNALFLSGDTIISWPDGELRPADATGAPGRHGGPDHALPRTGMFISEIARLAHGLEIGYRQSAEAERTAQLVRLQLLRAGMEEVG